MAQTKPARQKLHHYQPNRQAWDNWETMESDYRWWENTRQTKQIMWFQELFTILASSHSAIVHWGWDKTEEYVKKRFSGITQKVILKHVHINVQPTPTTKKCYSTTKRNRLTIQFRQIFHKPCWNSLNRFQKLMACQCKEKTHTWLLHVFDHFSKCLWMIFSHRQTKSSSDCWIRETVLHVWLGP